MSLQSEAETREDRAEEEREKPHEKKRETKSYMTLYTDLQAKVNAALTLAPFIKVEKGSQEMWAAMQGLLKGNGS